MLYGRGLKNGFSGSQLRNMWILMPFLGSVEDLQISFLPISIQILAMNKEYAHESEIVNFEEK